MAERNWWRRLRPLELSAGLCAGVHLGCVAAPPPRPQPPPAVTPAPLPTGPAPTPSAVVPAGAVQTAEGGDPVLGAAGELTAELVCRQVLARNPTLAQMAAATAAAAARYPQVTSLDDPSFTTWVAPASLGSNKVNDSARFEVSQKFPFPGKRALRGDAANAQTAAAGYDLEDAKLQLVEAARAALADYFLAERSLEVNAEGLKLLDEFKRNAETQYKTGQSPQQDVLQADVEIGRQNEQRLSLERARTVAVARLNTLMNLPPDHPLPPPAKALGAGGRLPDVAALRDAAVARRPDLQALAARIAADQAALGLAEREFYPDVEAMAAYDSFWQAADNQQRLRPQVGVRMNLPVRLARRRAAVAEAAAQLAQRRAALAQQTNQVAFDVQQAYAQVRESEQAVKLYAEKILPAARENVRAAQSAYMTAKVPFLTLLAAQQNLVGLRDRALQAAADYERRRAALERVIGGPLPAGEAPSPKAPPPEGHPPH